MSVRVISLALLPLVIISCSKSGPNAQSPLPINYEPAAISTDPTISPPQAAPAPTDNDDVDLELKKLRDEVKADIAQRLNDVGLSQEDIKLILEKMDESFDEGFSLTVNVRSASSIIQRMANAAVRAIGAMSTNSSDGSLRLNAIVTMTASFASHTVRNAERGEDLGQSLKAVSNVVSAGLAEAGIPPDQLGQTLAECGKALVVSVAENLTDQKNSLQDIMASAAAGLAAGAATSFAAEAVADAVQGLSRGIIEGALAADLSAASIAAIAAETMNTIATSLNEKGFDQEAISTQVLTGIVVAAKESTLAPTQLSAIIEQAAAVAPSVALDAIITAVDEQIAKNSDAGYFEKSGEFLLHYSITGIRYFTNKPVLTFDVTKRQNDGFSSALDYRSVSSRWISETLPQAENIKLSVIDEVTEIRWRLIPASERFTLDGYIGYLFASGHASSTSISTSTETGGHSDESEPMDSKRVQQTYSRSIIVSTSSATSMASSSSTSTAIEKWTNFEIYETLADSPDDAAYPWSKWTAIDSSLSVDISRQHDGNYFLQLDLKVKSKRLPPQPLFPFTIDRQPNQVSVYSNGDNPESSGRFTVYGTFATNMDQRLWGYQYWIGDVGFDCKKAPFQNYWFLSEIWIHDTENPPNILDLGEDHWNKGGSGRYPTTGVYRVCLKTVDQAGNVSEPFEVDATSALRHHYETPEANDPQITLIEAAPLPDTISASARAVQNASGVFLVGISADGKKLEISHGEDIHSISFTETSEADASTWSPSISLEQVGKTTAGNLFAIVRLASFSTGNQMLAYSDPTGQAWKSVSLPEGNIMGAHAVGDNNKIYLVWDKNVEVETAGEPPAATNQQTQDAPGETTDGTSRTTFVKQATLDISNNDPNITPQWSATEVVNAFDDTGNIASKIAISENKVHIVSVLRNYGAFYKFKSMSTGSEWSDEELVGFMIKDEDGEIHSEESFWFYGDHDWFIAQNYLYFISNYGNESLRKPISPGDMQVNYWERLRYMVTLTDSDSIDSSIEPERLPQSWFFPDTLFSSGSYLYAVSLYPEEGLQLYASSDKGQTWSKTTVITGFDWGEIFFDAWNDSKIAFVYRDRHNVERLAQSTDNGMSWNTTSRIVTPPGYYLSGYSDIGKMVNHKGYLFIFTNDEIWRRQITETSWSVAIDGGYDFPYDVATAVDSEYLYLAACNWFARSNDEGKTWEAKIISKTQSFSTTYEWDSCKAHLGISENGEITIAYVTQGDDDAWTLYRATSANRGSEFTVATPMMLGKRNNLNLRLSGATLYLVENSVENGHLNFVKVPDNSSTLPSGREFNLSGVNFDQIEIQDDRAHILVTSNRDRYITIDLSDASSSTMITEFEEGTKVLAFSLEKNTDSNTESIGFLIKKQGINSLYFQKLSGLNLLEVVEIDPIDFAHNYPSQARLSWDGNLVNVIYRSLYRGGINYMLSTDGGVSFSAPIE